jgi:hypothetical protein
MRLDDRPTGGAQDRVVVDRHGVSLLLGSEKYLSESLTGLFLVLLYR